MSGLLRVLCVLFLVVCALRLWQIGRGPIFLHGEGWGIGTAWYTYSGVEFKVYSLTVRERAIAAVSLALYWGFAFLCGIQLFRLLGAYSRGEIFTSQSAGQIRQFGLACIAWGIVKFSYGYLPLLIVDSRTTQSADLSLVLNGFIIVVISWFMEMAAELREDSELTV